MRDITRDHPIIPVFFFLEITVLGNFLLLNLFLAILLQNIDQVMADDDSELKKDGKSLISKPGEIQEVCPYEKT